MSKLNIKHTYTVIEGLHKTSHQKADLVCIIDMLGYLVLFSYIVLSHPRDMNKICWRQGTWCSMHCPLQFKFKHTLWSSHKHCFSPFTTFSQVGAHVSCEHKQKCGCELKTLISNQYGKFQGPAKYTPLVQACEAVSLACLSHTPQLEHEQHWCTMLAGLTWLCAHHALCPVFSRRGHVAYRFVEKVPVSL